MLEIKAEISQFSEQKQKVSLVVHHCSVDPTRIPRIFLKSVGAVPYASTHEVYLVNILQWPGVVGTA